MIEAVRDMQNCRRLFFSINLWLALILGSCFGPQEIEVRNYTDNRGSIQVKSGALPSVWQSTINDIVVNEGVAYVAAGPYGLQIVDVSDPLSPSPIKRIDFFSTSDDGNRKLNYLPSVLHLQGDILYVAGGCFPGMLFALDLTQPTAVLPLWNHGLTCASSIDASVDKISVADNYAGLLLLDRTDPTRIRTLGTVPPGEDTHAIYGAIDGNFAFVRMWNAGFNTTPLYLVDITKPAQPVVREKIEAGHISPQLNGNDTLHLFRHRNLLYQLTTQWLMVRPMVPNAPSQIVFAMQELTGAELPKVSDLLATDSNLYLVGPDIGLAILDLAKPDAVHIVGTYTATLKAASALWVEDNLVFIGDQKAGFQILDVTEASDPQLLYRVAP